MANDLQIQQGRGEWDTYVRLLRYARPYVARIGLGVLFGILFGGSTTGMLYGLKKTIASVFLAEGFPLVKTLGIAGLLIVFGIVRGLGDYLATYFIEWSGNRVVMDVRIATFAHLQDLSLGFFGRTKTGELISRVVNDTMLLERAVATVLTDLAKQPFTLIACVGFLIWLDARLALASLVLFPICILPVSLFGRKVRRAAREGQQRMADVVSILEESLTGVRIVKAFGMEHYEIARFTTQCKAVFSRIMRVVRSRAMVDPIIVFISLIGLSLVLVYARWANMGVDTFFAFGAALVAMYEPVKRLSRVHINVQQSSAAADRVFEILDTPVTVGNRPDAVEFHETVDQVSFEGVSFAYDSDPVLRDITLAARRGECIALVGSSGAGKTTLVSLLPRFYDVTGGRICINGRDIRAFTLDSLRRQIGMVTQETILFNDTVARNIAYGEDNADPGAIENAARRANAHDFIRELPDGYETLIGERGTRLSGGQRQRLAIARALLRNPPILLLDEATSSLDTESERLVQAALEQLMAGRTVFAIAHRLSTIIHADRILVLDGGRIVEDGPHAELIARNGAYKRLYDLQFRDAPAAP